MTLAVLFIVVLALNGIVSSSVKSPTRLCCSKRSVFDMQCSKDDILKAVESQKIPLVSKDCKAPPFTPEQKVLEIVEIKEEAVNEMPKASKTEPLPEKDEEQNDESEYGYADYEDSDDSSANEDDYDEETVDKPEHTVPRTETSMSDTVAIPDATPLVTVEKKKRFNFASFDCGAIIRETNSEAKSVTAILQENKDTYLLNQCDTEKFIVIELCEEILIDEIHIANLEYFSSTFRKVDVYLSDTYPVPETSESSWLFLVGITAQNVRQEQKFKVNHNIKWAKYVKLEFKSHYGSEFYCPVTLVRVFGKTVMEDLRGAEEENKQEIRDKKETFDVTDDHSGKSAVDNVFAWHDDKSLDAKWISLPSSFEELDEETNSKPIESSPSSNPLLTEGSKDSLLKSMMKRLLRLEQNVTIAQGHLYKQQKKLYKMYEELEDNLRKRVDMFLEALARRVILSVEDMKDEYETLFDKLVDELREVLSEVKYEVVSMKSDTEYLMGQMKILQRWILFQLIFILLFWRFRSWFYRQGRRLIHRFNLPEWLFRVETTAPTLVTPNIKKHLESRKNARKEMARRRSLPNLKQTENAPKISNNIKAQ
jgi:archaellum component FlaC